MRHWKRMYNNAKTSLQFKFDGTHVVLTVATRDVMHNFQGHLYCRLVYKPMKFGKELELRALGHVYEIYVVLLSDYSCCSFGPLMIFIRGRSSCGCLPSSRRDPLNNRPYRFLCCLVSCLLCLDSLYRAGRMTRHVNNLWM